MIRDPISRQKQCHRNEMVCDDQDSCMIVQLHARSKILAEDRIMVGSMKIKRDKTLVEGRIIVMIRDPISRQKQCHRNDMVCEDPDSCKMVQLHA